MRMWTCLQTKPRWEKKLGRWLAEHQMACFLPVVHRETVSHRRRRITTIPLFPGYVFVEGDRCKSDFRESRCVHGVLKPVGPAAVERLHRELWAIWQGLEKGSRLELTRPLTKGQELEIVAGPFKGMRGRFDRWTQGHRLVINMDLLNVGVAVCVSDGCVEVPTAA